MDQSDLREEILRGKGHINYIRCKCFRIAQTINKSRVHVFTSCLLAYRQPCPLMKILATTLICVQMVAEFPSPTPPADGPPGHGKASWRMLMW